MAHTRKHSGRKPAIKRTTRRQHRIKRTMKGGVWPFGSGGKSMSNADTYDTIAQTQDKPTVQTTKKQTAQPSRWNKTKKFFSGLFNKVGMKGKLTTYYKNGICNSGTSTVKYFILEKGQQLNNILNNNVSGKLLGTVDDTDCPKADYFNRLRQKGLISKINVGNLALNNPGNQNLHLTYTTNPRVDETSVPRICVYKEIDGKSTTESANENNKSSHIVYRYLTDGTKPSFITTSGSVQLVYYLFMTNVNSLNNTLVSLIPTINKNIKNNIETDKQYYSNANFKTSLIDDTYTTDGTHNEILGKCKLLFNENKLGVVYQLSNENAQTFDNLSTNIEHFRVYVNSNTSVQQDKNINEENNMSVFLLMCPTMPKQTSNNKKGSSQPQPQAERSANYLAKESTSTEQPGYLSIGNDPNTGQYEEPRVGTNGNGGYINPNNLRTEKNNPEYLNLSTLPGRPGEPEVFASANTQPPNTPRTSSNKRGGLQMTNVSSSHPLIPGPNNNI